MEARGGTSRLLRPGSSPRRTLGHALTLAVTFLAVLGLPRGAYAHPVPFSFLDLRLSGNTLEGALVLHVFDVGHELSFDPADRLLDAAVAASQSQAIVDSLAGRFFITVDGRAIRPAWTDAEVLSPRQSLRLRFRHSQESSPGLVSVRAVLFPYDPRHQTFLNVYEGEALTQAILGRDRPVFDYYAGTVQGRFAVVRRFIPAGVEHILIGPDHLLFLVGLLLLGGSIRRLAVVVTAFTLAHTITLSLAALNIVTPPAHIIEPLIALSIVYVGADNLLRRGGRDTRAWIAFVFGFVHGFGFAYVLRAMDLPARALGWSLFSFNAGVEVGQLLLVVVMGAVLAGVRARSAVAGDRVAVIGSVGVMAAGMFWYIQRVFFLGGNS